MNLICRIITMKALYLTFPLILLFSCTKANVSDEPASAEYGNLDIHISGTELATKASGSNNIDSLAVFVYENDMAFSVASGVSTGNENKLVAFKCLKVGSTGASGVSTSLKVPTGSKKVVVLINPHIYLTNPDLKHGLAERFVFYLNREVVNSFTMYGVSEAVNITPNTTTNVNITLQRLVSKISLTDIQVELDSPYNGKTLESVFAYLKKANARITLNHLQPSFLKVDGSKSSDRTSFGDKSAFIRYPGYEDIADGQNSQNSNRSLYTYAHADFKPILVIKGLFDDMWYYYPIVINANPNEHISLKVKITGPGSITPDEPYLKGAVVTSLTIEPLTDRNAPDINFTEKFTN